MLGERTACGGDRPGSAQVTQEPSGVCVSVMVTSQTANVSAHHACVIDGFLCVFPVSAEVVGDLNKRPPHHLCLRSDCHLLRD